MDDVDAYDINQIKISEELLINKDYVLKSLKHYVYLLIINNYTNNRELYYYLLHNYIFKLNSVYPDKSDKKEEIPKNILSFMLNSKDIYKDFLIQSFNLKKYASDDKETDKLEKFKNDMKIKKGEDNNEKYKQFDMLFRVLLYCLFNTNYIQSENTYSLTCLQLFVLSQNNKTKSGLDVFNYINFIYHLTLDSSQIYSASCKSDKKSNVYDTTETTRQIYDLTMETQKLFEDSNVVKLLRAECEKVKQAASLQRSGGAIEDIEPEVCINAKLAARLAERAANLLKVINTSTLKSSDTPTPTPAPTPTPTPINSSSIQDCDPRLNNLLQKLFGSAYKGTTKQDDDKELEKITGKITDIMDKANSTPYNNAESISVNLDNFKDVVELSKISKLFKEDKKADDDTIYSFDDDNTAKPQPIVVENDKNDVKISYKDALQILEKKATTCKELNALIQKIHDTTFKSSKSKKKQQSIKAFENTH